MDLENKKAELQKSTSAFQQQLAGLQENNAYNSNLNLQIEQEDVIFTNDVFIPPSTIASNYYPIENEMHAQTESSPNKLILDSKDLFRYPQE
jgi:hypothetical protein